MAACSSPVASGGSTAVQLHLGGQSRGDAPLLDRPPSESQHSHEFLLAIRNATSAVAISALAYGSFWISALRSAQVFGRFGEM